MPAWVGFAGQVMTVIPAKALLPLHLPRPAAAGEIPTCKEAGVLRRGGRRDRQYLEATEAVKLIAGVGEPLVARMLTVDALTMNIRRSHCQSMCRIARCVR